MFYGYKRYCYFTYYNNRVCFIYFRLFVSDDPNVKIISVTKDNVKIEEDVNKEDVNKEDSTQIKNKINEAITTLQEIKVSLD